MATNQVEPTNSFKDELFGFTATPRKTITWTMNYYLGQDHPDRISVPPDLRRFQCSPASVLRRLFLPPTVAFTSLTAT